MGDPAKALTAHAWSTHDPACSQCRGRKVRCGRERPKCAHCQRDGAPCDYSDHGKRVNHTKLLVNNVVELDDRLVGIEKQLTQLTDLIRTHADRRPRSRSRSRSTSTSTSRWRSMGDVPDEDDAASKPPASVPTSTNPSSCSSTTGDTLFQPSLPAAGRRVVRCDADGSARFHGPGSLVPLTYQFYHSLTPTDGAGDDAQLATPDHAGRRELLSQLFQGFAARDAARDGDAGAAVQEKEGERIQLPPRQLLQMAAASFFLQDDPTTDVFCEATFWSNVDRLYGQLPARTDHPWALCFNIIVLLVLSANQSSVTYNTGMASYFVHPLLATVQEALRDLGRLMCPTLINVQALTLLSVVAQQFLQPLVAETCFANACVLAKIMGLHQRRFPITPDRRADEDEGQLKVFTSLFLMDKAHAFTHGVHCWLPAFDSSAPFWGAEHRLGKLTCARLELGRLQEDIYVALYSTLAAARRSQQVKTVVKRLGKRLADWSQEYQCTDAASPSLPPDVQLDVLAARIAICSQSSDDVDRARIFDDARAHCRIFVSAGPTHRSPSPAAAGRGHTGPATGGHDAAKPPSELSSSDERSNAKGPRLRSFADHFSPLAFFALAGRLAHDPSLAAPAEAPETDDDLRLLRGVSQAFRRMGHHNALLKTYHAIASAVFDTVLADIEARRALRHPLAATHNEPGHHDPAHHGTHAPSAPPQGTLGPEFSALWAPQPLGLPTATFHPMPVSGNAPPPPVFPKFPLDGCADVSLSPWLGFDSHAAGLRDLTTTYHAHAHTQDYQPPPAKRPFQAISATGFWPHAAV